MTEVSAFVTFVSSLFVRQAVVCLFVCVSSGVSRGVFWLPGNPPPAGHDFFNQWGGALTDTDLHQPLAFATFGNPP